MPILVVRSLVQNTATCSKTLYISVTFLLNCSFQARKSKEKKQTLDLEDAFKSADTDKDGKLTLDEWANVLSRTGHNITRSVL